VCNIHHGRILLCVCGMQIVLCSCLPFGWCKWKTILLHLALYLVNTMHLNSLILDYFQCKCNIIQILHIHPPLAAKFHFNIWWCIGVTTSVTIIHLTWYMCRKKHKILVTSLATVTLLSLHCTGHVFHPFVSILAMILAKSGITQFIHNVS